MSDVRIVTMQQETVSRATTIHDGVQINELNQLLRRRAEAELAQASADGFEIVDTATGGNERVVLTTWTLRPAAKVVFEGESGFLAPYAANEKVPKPKVNASSTSRGFYDF